MDANLENSYLEKIEKNKGIIFIIITLYADDPTDKEDLFQEILYHSFRSFPSFQGKSKFSTWLYKIS